MKTATTEGFDILSLDLYRGYVDKALKQRGLDCTTEEDQYCILRCGPLTHSLMIPVKGKRPEFFLLYDEAEARVRDFIMGKCDFNKRYSPERSIPIKRCGFRVSDLRKNVGCRCVNLYCTRPDGGRTEVAGGSFCISLVTPHEKIRVVAAPSIKCRRCNTVTPNVPLLFGKGTERGDERSESRQLAEDVRRDFEWYVREIGQSYKAILRPGPWSLNHL